MYFEYIHSEIIDDRIDAQFFTPEYIKSLKKINQFRIETLGNISRRIFDPPHTAPEFVDKSDFEMIMIENITLNGIEGNFRAISETCHKDIFKNSHLEGNELLVSRVGNSSGTFASVFPCYKGKKVSGNISIIKLKDEIIDKEYAFAYFNSNIGQNSIKRNIANTARKFLTISKIREFQIPIPSPEIQKYIGDKVRKAEELREEAKRLKKEAEEIFFNEINIVSIDNAFKKEQHIKFNWINIDELDVNRIDAEYNRRKYTILVKLLIDNNITLIPISNLLEEPIVSGSTPKGGNYIENGIPFVRATNLCEYSIDDNLVYISKEESDKLKNSEIRSGDVVFSIAGSIGVASIIPSYIEKANINQALVRLRLNNINKYYFVFVVNSSIGRLLSLRLANGAVQLNLNREEVGNIMVPRINDNKEEIIANKIKLYIELLYQSKQLIQEAKQDVEDLIEGNFDMSKVKANS